MANASTEITVGAFRQFLSDMGNSMADDGAGRILDRVMQSTMRRLSRQGKWGWKRKSYSFLIEPTKSCEFGTVANGGTVVTTNSGATGAYPILNDYFRDGWLVFLGDRETIYEIVETPDPFSFKVRPAYQGTALSSTGKVVLAKTVYQLPERAQRIYDIDLPQQSAGSLSYASQDDFETIKRGLRTSNSQPYHWTQRGPDTIEIWPPPPADTTYEAEIDYQAEIRVPRLDAEDTEVLDWPESYEDLLWAAAKVELVSELGADAVHFDAAQAGARYQEMLTEYKAEDRSRGPQVWSMNPPRSSAATRFRLNLRTATTDES